MYRIRTSNHRKSDQVMRWALPDRVFFACGACHILAHAFLELYGTGSEAVFWLKPSPGFTGHHIFVRGEAWVFDYHGFSRPDRFLAHTFRRARHHWPGWEASLVELPRSVLISAAGSRDFDRDLWLREPLQFLHDAMPRARDYVRRFPAPPVGMLGP